MIKRQIPSRLLPKDFNNHFKLTPTCFSYFIRWAFCEDSVFVGVRVVELEDYFFDEMGGEDGVVFVVGAEVDGPLVGVGRGVGVGSFG